MMREESLRLIRDCASQMNDRYGKPVFDEWAVVSLRHHQAQVIAYIGNTGLATGPHLHYEVHVSGRAVDPLNYVLPVGVVTD